MQFSPAYLHFTHTIFAALNKSSDFSSFIRPKERDIYICLKNILAEMTVGKQWSLNGWFTILFSVYCRTSWFIPSTSRIDDDRCKQNFYCLGIDGRDKLLLKSPFKRTKLTINCPIESPPSYSCANNEKNRTNERKCDACLWIILSKVVKIMQR